MRRSIRYHKNKRIREGVLSATLLTTLVVAAGLAPAHMPPSLQTGSPSAPTPDTLRGSPVHAGAPTPYTPPKQHAIVHGEETFTMVRIEFEDGSGRYGPASFRKAPYLHPDGEWIHHSWPVLYCNADAPCDDHTAK